MRLIVLSISNPKPYRTICTQQKVVFIDGNNKRYKLTIYSNDAFSIRWIPFIKPQAVFDGVDILPETNVINRKSNFKYVGQRSVYIK